MKTTLFATSRRRSPLTEVQGMNSKRKRGKGFSRDLALALPLTSLIDAFSIIVIYLLIGTQNGGTEMAVPNSLNLPVAEQSTGVEKEMPILRIQKGRYFLNDKLVSAKGLTQSLTDLKKNTKDIELMVQADQEMQYADLDPLLKAGSLAGIEKLKFAVIPSQ